MQLIGIISVAATAPRMAPNNELYYFSVDEQLKLSNNENVIVFILDNMNVECVDKIFANDPTAIDVFDGFTYSTNNLAEYPFTFPNIISLLTGKIANKQVEDQVKFKQDAWRDEILFEALREKNFKTNALLDITTTFYDFNDLYFKDGTPKIANIKKLNSKNREVQYGKFFNTITRMAFARQSSYYMKSQVLQEGY